MCGCSPVGNGEQTQSLDYKRVNSGLLVQDRDQGMVAMEDFKVVGKRVPTAEEMKDLAFAGKWQNSSNPMPLSIPKTA